MERKEQKGTILSVKEDFMKDYNKDNKTQRVVLSFIFNVDDNGEEDETASFLLPLVQRPKTIIIDLESVAGDGFSEKIKEAKKRLEGKVTTFTTYTAQISELNESGKTAVKNDERRYTNYSRSYVGKHNDPESVLNILKNQLAKDIESGDVEFCD